MDAVDQCWRSRPGSLRISQEGVRHLVDCLVAPNEDADRAGPSVFQCLNAVDDLGGGDTVRYRVVDRQPPRLDGRRYCGVLEGTPPNRIGGSWDELTWISMGAERQGDLVNAGPSSCVTDSLLADAGNEAGVDHLVGVCERHQTRLGCQDRHELPLFDVRVLELVADHKRPASLVQLADDRRS
jgi:hypothetical protein